MWHDGPSWVSEARIDKTEYTGGPTSFGESKDKESSQSYSEESDEEFNWYDQSLADDTLFVLVNNNRATFNPGDQVYYCYGNRSNKYLLINYGFCFPGNRYSSYRLNLRMDCDLR